MDSREMFLVMGYGETPLPEIELASTLDEAFNAVARMVYGDPSPSELLEARADFCDFEERVRDGFEWHAEFEIGGIRAWKVCVPDDLVGVVTAPSSDATTAAQLDPYGFDVMLGERMYIDSSQHYRNGTVNLTIKRKAREAIDAALAKQQA
ncbi:hypothetical protein ACT2FY_13165 [Paraburkholderia fungorum]|uniref:hypothetical protein n=1 Tax=Paraburkholderia fungorum TaxID=134537 RepID=UPI00402BB958